MNEMTIWKKYFSDTFGSEKELFQMNKIYSWNLSLSLHVNKMWGELYQMLVSI